ncbi:Aminotransferase class-III [Acididesulfobacillus acetoxydans]|uniref:alanine--glyoxylate transaminase n=1 Tax=Acididesulfobacillus acetoxydans TaxID=1561005 RepID=A0A8S0XBC2_9FIRM|nr:aspartate aminotransferase family protein [Acididesulfobacillus acetoxydans]CAA7601046.1 Aminotransferase class-III [Acididesulfobacillus acetoxydans]CEJ06920.1 Alanine--glyoxylate aminotransferase 2, mitochondrial [Acididesulfobacillus acetoxydans]
MNATEQYLAKRDKYLMAQARHQLYRKPLIVERGSMEYLYDIEGREYLDCFSGILVTNCGHCNPEINAAAREQLDKLQHTSTFFLTRPMLDLAEKLAEITPEGLVRSFFVNSGSEAVDGAILLARKYTGSKTIIPVKMAYHGRTQLASSCTNISIYSDEEPGSEVLNIRFGYNGYCYRCPFQAKYPECGLKCAHAVEELIRQSPEKQIAAILVEPIQGVGGVITPPPGYLEVLEHIAHYYGGLLIIDEVQSGLGRTGRMFATSESGVSADILCLGKGLANGLPLAAYIAKDGIGESIDYPTFSTFGGNPLSSATALATIDYLIEHRLAEKAERAGERFRQGLEEIARESRWVGEVRGRGLFLAMELVREPGSKEPATEETLAIINECKENGLIVGKSGPFTNVLRVGPALTITDEQIDQALAILRRAFKTVEEKMGVR